MRFRLLTAAILSGALASAAWGDALADLRAQISAAWAKQTSVSAKYRAWSKSEYASAGVSSETRAEGTHEFARRDGREQARIELAVQTVHTAAGKQTTEQQNILRLIDGDVMYRLESLRGETKAMKTKAERRDTGAPDLVLDHYAATLELTPVGEQSVSGRKAWVIEAVPKKLEPSDAVKKTLLYFDQETGFLVRAESIAGDDRLVQTIEYTELKFGAPIPAERFVFTPPPGVAVFDGTQGVPPPPKPPTAGGPRPAPATQPATQPGKP